MEGSAYGQGLREIVALRSCQARSLRMRGTAVGIKLLWGFAYVWFCLIGSLIVLSVGFLWCTEGFSNVQENFSPFNLVNSIVTLVSLAPGIGAYMLAKRLTERSDRRTWDDSTALVHAYGAALEATAATNSIVVDQKHLPAPKDQIKAALLVALHTTQDPQMREHLKIGYLSLAAFHPGVGDAQVSLGGINLPPIPDPNDHEGIVALARAEAETAPEAERWRDISFKEHLQLAVELDRAGF
jgi:hypothetical protein